MAGRRAARASPPTWKQWVSDGVSVGSVVAEQVPLKGWLILEIAVCASTQCVVTVVGKGTPFEMKLSVGPPKSVFSQLFVSTFPTFDERQARKLAKASMKMALVLAWWWL